MLVFAALVTGCTHSSESHNADASATAPTEQSSEAATPSGPQPATAAEAAEAMDASERTDATAAGGGSAAIAENDATPAAKPIRTDETACVDAWLSAKNLDRYGSPEGTMYAGGTPLFDERTGERAERLPFIYKRHPAAQKACQADGQPTQQAK